MEHHKVITREDGTKYQINVTILTDSLYNETVSWRVNVVYKEKNKRKWKPLPTDLYDYQIRELNFKDKRKYYESNFLNYVTKDEILEAKLELWNKIKPE